MTIKVGPRTKPPHEFDKTRQRFGRSKRTATRAPTTGRQLAKSMIRERADGIESLLL